MVSLSGKVSTEHGIRTTATKFFNFVLKQLHHVQNVTERVHQTKLQQGDWYNIGSVRHWTYVIDGKVVTCKDNIDAIDERNMIITYNVFEGDVSQQFKTLKLIFQAIDKDDGSAFVKWTFEYEKINEKVEPPYSYVDLFTKITKDIDTHLVQA
ncbi:MLP-like protein 43 [Gastrolobium bilobum]|uniref:MLP-like protein 43 n=1 Tax=Gastrolobium bilobum TaxID=150636 RepID=UPI002AB0FA2A|nr:MLP-like protein 43 [Gastrolobium bilobum]XP_061366038.1 MLP-like protein 43 [Gastrolobium bilobum]